MLHLMEEDQAVDRAPDSGVLMSDDNVGSDASSFGHEFSSYLLGFSVCGIATDMQRPD